MDINIDIDTESVVDKYTKLSKSDIIEVQNLNTKHPRGGFPPILLCEKKKDDDKKISAREFLNKKTNIPSIKDILLSRRKNK